MAEALAGGDREGSVSPPSELVPIDAAGGGDHLRANAVEHVVERSGASGPVGSEPVDQSELVQLRHPVTSGREVVEADRRPGWWSRPCAGAASSVTRFAAPSKRLSMRDRRCTQTYLLPAPESGVASAGVEGDSTGLFAPCRAGR